MCVHITGTMYGIRAPQEAAHGNNFYRAVGRFKQIGNGRAHEVQIGDTCAGGAAPKGGIKPVAPQSVDESV